MSQPPSPPPPQQVPEGIEPSAIPKDHRISADQAESSAQIANTELCPRCFSIEPKIQELLSLDPKIIREVEHTVLELQSADDLFQSPSCPLCQNLKFICPKIWFTDQKRPARLVVARATGRRSRYVAGTSASSEDLESDAWDSDAWDSDVWDPVASDPVASDFDALDSGPLDSDASDSEHEEKRRRNEKKRKRSKDTRHLCLTLAHGSPQDPHLRIVDVFDARAVPWIQDAVGYIAEKAALEQNPGTAFANSLPALVDFKRLQEWLKSSEREETTTEGTNLVRSLFVIHCESREIIKAPLEKYVALSYVWGQENPKEGELEEREGRLYLKRGLERTIEDALTVTRQLNLRYLWIDRYCIPQDDLKYQISKMHEIYGGAHVTIIAAAGNSPQHGLPGVNQTRHTGPPPVKIGSRTLLATFPTPKLLVEESKWYSRGWTFQEGLLSRRRLVFTDHQVFFHCDKFIFFEAFSEYLPCGIDLRDAHIPPLGPLFSFASARRSRQGAPWDKIAQYCALDLTNPEDTVDAILGILNYYQEGTLRLSATRDEIVHQRAATIRHITGLPISRRIYRHDRDETWEDAIICALFWKSRTPGDSRKPERMPFPSWSWAGWKCDCYFGGLMPWQSWDFGAPDLRPLRGSLERARNLNGHLPSILIETEEPESLIQATEYETMFNEMHDFSKIRYLHVTALTVDARIVTYDDDRPDERTDPWNLDNTGRKLALECSGAEKLVFLNLTSDSIYQQPVPLSGHPCLAIILDDDSYTESERYHSPWACLLVVGKTEDCYERIGVAYVRRKALIRKAHVNKREDIKLG